MYVHGGNLMQKENSINKYTDSLSKKYLAEIREKYDAWKAANEELVGPLKESTDNDFSIIEKRVELFNTYKNFLDQQHYAEHFDSRSNLHSSVLEEFMYYLFNDLVKNFSDSALIGKSHAFKDIFFKNTSFDEMISKPHIQIEVKDHDFVIGVRIESSFNCEGQTQTEKYTFDIPAIAIECKTYLDKTMLEGSSTAGEQLKMRNPDAIYIVVAERLKLTESVNLKKYKVDQIYVLRKQKNTDREYRYLSTYTSNPIYSDVVWHLFETVRDYLTTDWEGTIADGLVKGYLI